MMDSGTKILSGLAPKRLPGRTPRSQRGLALITAVLVVAIVATVATTLALGEQVWFRQAQNMTDRAQAISLRQGAVSYAAILLGRDGAQNQVDHLKEIWAQPLPPSQASTSRQPLKRRWAKENFIGRNVASPPRRAQMQKAATKPRGGDEKWGRRRRRPPSGGRARSDAPSPLPHPLCITPCPG